MVKGLISIIIPAYNIEQYISRCLDSVVKQSYKDLEIIVVDDGSTDKTGTIIDEYCKLDSRIIPIHKKNGGVSQARIEGIKKAKGEYIGFVDGDDYIDEDMYEKLVNNMRKYDAEISHCGYKMVFPSRVDFYYNTGNIVLQNTEKGLEDLLKGENVEPGLGNKLYCARLFKEQMNVFMEMENIKINEDLLMNYFLFKNARLSIYEDFCPYHYILRKGSAATSLLNENKLKDPIKVLEIILNNIDKENSIYSIVEMRLIQQMVNVISLSSKGQCELVEPYKKKIKQILKAKIWSIIKNPTIKKSIKIKSLWVILCPASYRWMHLLYMKMTGIDKKYVVE